MNSFLKPLLCSVAALAAASAAHAQLPPPPVSPLPVVKHEYDAQGNPTKTYQAPDAAGFNFKTENTYDPLYRVKDTTDAKQSKIKFEHDGQDRVTKVTDPRNLVTESPRTGLGDAKQLISPDTGTTINTYDAAGNLKTRTDQRGVLATYNYDALNRLIDVSYTKSGSTTQTFRWNYDQVGPEFSNGIGRLTSTNHPTGWTQYTHDAHGRVLTAKQAADHSDRSAVTTTVSYGYDAAGNITSIVYPSGRKLVISYANGLPSAMSLAESANANPVPVISQIGFTPFGPPERWTWHFSGNVTRTDERIHDSAGRLVRYRLGNVVRDVTYDAASRITAYTHYDATSESPLSSLNQTFGYDAVGRITNVTAFAGTSTWVIDYDPTGNRTSVVLNGVTTVYNTSLTSNRLDSLTNPTRAFLYDDVGNTLQDANNGYTATYDLSGRLARIQKGSESVTYAYNALGQRTRKYSNQRTGGATFFVYDQAGQLLGEYTPEGVAIREYVWLGSMPVAVFTPDSANAANPPVIYHVHADHLGAPRVVTDRSGALRWTWFAEPFGNTAPDANPQGLGAFTYNLRFPGQYFDREAGLHYNYFRDYNSAIGRYAQSDPIGLDGGVNTYGYVGGSPANHFDPDGRLAMLLPLMIFGEAGGTLAVGSGTIVAATGIAAIGVGVATGLITGPRGQAPQPATVGTPMAAVAPSAAVGAPHSARSSPLYPSAANDPTYGGGGGGGGDNCKFCRRTGLAEVTRTQSGGSTIRCQYQCPQKGIKYYLLSYSWIPFEPMLTCPLTMPESTFP